MSFDEGTHEFYERCAMDSVDDAVSMLDISISCLYEAKHRINEAVLWSRKAGDEENIEYTLLLKNHISDFIKELEDLNMQMMIS